MKESEQLRIKTHLSRSRSRYHHNLTSQQRQSHEATHFPFHYWFEVCVKAKSPDGRHTKQLVDTEHIPVIEFDYAFATDTPGDPNRKISMMIATNSIHGCSAVVARREGGQDNCVMQSFQNHIDRLGLVNAELKLRPGAKHSHCGKRCGQTVSIHKFDCDCHAKKVERELGAWKTSTFDNSGTAASDLNMCS